MSSPVELVDQLKQPADTTMTCTGHPFRRFGLKRPRRICEQTFAVPAAANPVICPWYVTTRQPGPAA
jgi:hypothetical protein